MKRSKTIIDPHTQTIGKIDISDILNSSIPRELHYIGAGRIEKLKQGESITVTVHTITTIQIQKY
ncbi:hypothetical protein [Flavobacterium sp. 3-210]